MFRVHRGRISLYAWKCSDMIRCCILVTSILSHYVWTHSPCLAVHLHWIYLRTFWKRTFLKKNLKVIYMGLNISYFEISDLNLQRLSKLMTLGSGRIYLRHRHCLWFGFWTWIKLQFPWFVSIIWMIVVKLYVESSSGRPQSNLLMIPLLELISALTLSMPDETSLIDLAKCCLQSLDSYSPFKNSPEIQHKQVKYPSLTPVM